MDPNRSIIPRFDKIADVLETRLGTRDVPMRYGSISEHGIAIWSNENKPSFTQVNPTTYKRVFPTLTNDQKEMLEEFTTVGPALVTIHDLVPAGMDPAYVERMKETIRQTFEIQSYFAFSFSKTFQYKMNGDPIMDAILEPNTGDSIMCHEGAHAAVKRSGIAKRMFVDEYEVLDEAVAIDTELAGLDAFNPCIAEQRRIYLSISMPVGEIHKEATRLVLNKDPRIEEFRKEVFHLNKEKRQ